MNFLQKLFKSLSWWVDSEPEPTPDAPTVEGAIAAAPALIAAVAEVINKE